jgi:hypothetical protein
VTGRDLVTGQPAAGLRKAQQPFIPDQLESFLPGQESDFTGLLAGKLHKNLRVTHLVQPGLQRYAPVHHLGNRDAFLGCHTL